jgi:hypothetical protein
VSTAGWSASGARTSIVASKIGLEKVRDMDVRGRLSGPPRKYFELIIADQSFGFSLRDDQIANEPALGGVYAIRTDLGKPKMSADNRVSNYKT